MADNTTLNPGVGGDTIASEDIAGVKIQRVKLALGDVDTDDGDIASGNPIPVSDDGGSLTVDGPLTDAQLRATAVPVSGTVTTGGLTDTQLRATAVPVSGPLTDTQLRATAVPISVATIPSHAVTNAGTFAVQAAATQSGTWTVQPGNTANTTAWKVDGSAVTQPVSGPLTDTQLRATAVPVQGVIEITTPNPIAVIESDGANSTLGTQADAKSTATDTTPITVMQVLKQISASVQAPPSQAVTQSGTWTVQPGNTANTTAWKVDGSAVTQPVSGTFFQATQPVSIAATVVTKEARAATPSQSSVANSASSVTVLASNSNRLGATIFNDDTAGTGATLKVKLGATASASSFTVAIEPQGYYEVPFNYTGIIDGIASAATGNARITELTA